MDSTAVKWIVERLKNGGCVSDASMNDEGIEADLPSPLRAQRDNRVQVTILQMPTFVAVFENDFSAAEDIVTDIIEDLGHTVADFFSSNGVASASDMLAKLGSEVLTSLISALKITVLGLAKVAAKLVAYFRTVGDTV